MIELRKKFTFESAHFLPFFPDGHKCKRLHGHSFVVEICVTGEPDPKTGVLIDYAEISNAVKPLIELLDHRLINEVGLELKDQLLCNPTSENLAIWFHKQLELKLPRLSGIIVYETCTSTCIYEKT